MKGCSKISIESLIMQVQIWQYFWIYCKFAWWRIKKNCLLVSFVSEIPNVNLKPSIASQQIDVKVDFLDGMVTPLY